MTYVPLSPSTSYDPVDLAPIAARYQLLIGAFMTLLSAGHYTRLPVAAQRIYNVVRVYIKACAHNRHIALKMGMLSAPLWRARVLKELGGARKLSHWLQAYMRAANMLPASSKAATPSRPAWLDTPERRAQSEALKAYKRLCAKACVPTGTYRDPYKMDREGHFRLAPISRQTTDRPRITSIYTAQTIGDYIYNPIPVLRPVGYGPAIVTPLEFIAAARMDIDRDNALAVTTPAVTAPALRTLSQDTTDTDADTFYPLPEFIGPKTYFNLFFKPP